ncbi:hypothetical protein [Chitinivorax sp. B]|uniref:hypothetical protein n=1 Tax=Chitinivorax sp. B TaxID=2502235 RepID=UPI001484DF4A|nr:hypothetical protein [Chitinivorax sp. B]
MPDSFSVLDAATVQGVPKRKPASSKKQFGFKPMYWLAGAGAATLGFGGWVAWMALAEDHQSAAVSISAPAGEPVAPTVPVVPVQPVIAAPAVPVQGEGAEHVPIVTDPTARLESVLSAKDQPASQPEDELTSVFSPSPATAAAATATAAAAVVSGKSAVSSGAKSPGTAKPDAAAASKYRPSNVKPKSAAKQVKPSAKPIPKKTPQAATGKQGKIGKSGDADVIRDAVLSHIKKSEKQTPGSKPRE